MPLDVNEFANKIKAKYPEYKDVDNNLLAEKMIEKYPEYKGKVSFDPPKKKVATGLQSEQPKVSSSSATQGTEEQKPLVSSGSVKSNVFTGYPGKEKNEYKIEQGKWLRKEPNGKWEVVNNSGSIIGLNKQFKKNIVPAADLSKVNSSLMDKSEEEVVPFLKSNYGNLGFVFEQVGLGTDKVRVMTKDGANSEVFHLDNWTSGVDSAESIRLKAFLKEHTETLDRQKQIALNQQILDIKNTNKAPNVEGVDKTSDMWIPFEQRMKKSELEKEYLKGSQSRLNKLTNDLKNAKKTKGTYDDEFVRARISEYYGNSNELSKQKEYVANNLQDINRASEFLKKENDDVQKKYEQYKVALDENNGIETEELKTLREDFQSKDAYVKANASALNEVSNDVIGNAKKLEKITVEHLLSQQKKGTSIGAIRNAFIRGFANFADEETTNAMVQLFGSDYTTEEFENDPNASLVRKALTGISRSMGVVTSGSALGPYGAVASLVHDSYESFKKGLDEDPNLNTMSEEDKEALSMSVGLVGGILEEFGITSVMKGTKIGNRFTNYLLSKALKGLPAKASTEMIEAAVKDNLGNLIKSKAIKIVGGALIEGSTEFTQDLAESSITELYDLAKGKDLFSNKDWLSTAGESFIIGAIGGGLVKTPSEAVSLIKDGFDLKNNNKNTFIDEVLTDEQSRDALKDIVKSKILSKELTPEQAAEQIKAIDEVSSTLNKINPELSNEDKYTSFNLIQEKKKLEKDIQGKDEASVFAQKERINAINEELKTISLNNATTQQQEVPTESSTVEYQGANEGQQEVGQGEGSERTAEKPEANISDSNIPSEEAQVILPTKNKAGEITGYISQVTDVDGNVVDIEGKTEAEVQQKIDDIQQTIEQPTLDELKTLDVSDKTNLQKVQSFLDNALNDLDAFGKETLGMNLPVAVARVVLKTVKTLVDAGVSLEQAFKQAAETHNVQEVDIADTLTAISNKKKSTEASKAAKNISKKEKTKVIVDEYSALRDQIRLEARAAKDVKKKQADMIAAINTSSKTGKISAAKAKALINKIQKVKLESDKSVNEFLNYVERIFKDAEYGDKLSKSQSLRAKIRKGIKREGVQAQVAGTLKAFSKIDPKKVENIDEYKAYAEQLTEASKTTRVTTDNKVEFKQPAELADINKYTSEELKRQEDINKKELMDEFDSLVEQGLIDDSMSLNDMKKYIDSLETTEEDTSKKKETEVRKYVDAKFKKLSTIINEMISSGKDVFTDEDLDISKKDMQRLKDIMNINLDKLKLKDAFQVVEHLNNFITNGITSNLDNIQATYDGQINAENLEKSGLKSYAIKLLFSPKIGKFFGKQTMSLPTFLDNIFGGEKRSLAFSKAMGLTNFMNSKSQAIVRYRNKMAQHKAQFEKKRPNGKDFNASDNIQERGVFAYLLRNSLDGDTSMFKDRVSNTLITIDKLLNSKDKNEIKKGEILNTVADKLGLRDENVTIESVTANVDPINQQDVDWWVNTWGEIYDELADVSLAVYNIELSPDAFYTTDTVSDTDRVDSFLSDENLSGLRRTLTTQPDDKRTGVLRENNRHKVTAKGSTMINFNFDANQDRAFKAALVDLHTAKDIRQIKSFLKSESFKNIMDSKEDAELLALKVTNSIKRSKGKSLEESDQIAKDVEKLANKAASLGTSMVLGRPSQWLLQTTPVLWNTLINTGDLNIRNMFNKSANEFIANSGRGIALRGKESLSMIESAEKYLDKNPDSILGKSMEAFDWMNNKYLELFLVNADTFTANASWLAYYEQSLRKQGVHPGGKIDWANHEMNEEAADYAQHKIDRQQNISDPDFGGELFTSKTPYVRMGVKAIMPFSNFIMNQKSRMYADLKALKRGDADEKASAARSLAGLAVESIVYRAMSGIIGYGLWTLANGEASDEEKEKKKKRSMNNAVSSVVTDVFALAPAMNSTTIKAFNALTAFGQDYLHNDELDKLVLEENKKREEDRKPKMGTAEEEEFRRLALEEMIFQIDEYEAKDSGLGVFGIAYEKGGNLVDLVKKRAFGKYMDENPLTKVKSTKYLVEKDQKDMSLALTLQALHTLRLLPQELSQVSGYLDREISKNALSPKQFDKYNEMKKVMKIDTDKQYVMDIVKSTSKLENSIQELKYIEENGGFTDKEYKEFLILKKEYGRSALGLIDNIKSGKTAKQIMGK